MPRKRWLSLAVASVFALSSDPVAAQDSLYAVTEPASVFSAGAQYLFTTRNTDFDGGSSFINGPDTGALNFNNAEFDFQTGIRGFLAVSGNGMRIEGVYSSYGAWNSRNTGTLTNGLAFDEGITNDWTGANNIDLTTGFQSLHAAASSAMGGDPDEHEGLEPSASFAVDDLPAYDIEYRSVLSSFELNLISEEPAARYQVGLGYRNLQLDESASVGIQGSLRAVDIGAPNGGLSHGAITTFGGLNHLAGTADGFEDETGNPSGQPDMLQMFNIARTSNDLNGAQLIFSEQVMYWQGWTINGLVKTGLYHNHASASVSERYIGTDPSFGGDSSTYGRTFTSSKSQVAFAGSVGLQSNFPLSNHWSIFSGYEMTYIAGVALAPEQYDRISGPTFVDRSLRVDAHGDLFVHGGNLGLLFSY